MTFIATEIRRDGYAYSMRFDATDWDEAREICEQEGWTLDGELVASIPTRRDFSRYIWGKP